MPVRIAALLVFPKTKVHKLTAASAMNFAVVGISKSIDGWGPAMLVQSWTYPKKKH